MECGVIDHKARNTLCFGQHNDSNMMSAAGTQYSHFSVMLSEMLSLPPVSVSVSLCSLWVWLFFFISKA